MKQAAVRTMASSEVVSIIRHSGDTLDADSKRRRRVTRVGRMASVAAGAFPLFASGSYLTYPENYITPLLTGTAIGVAAHAGRHIVNKRRIATAEALQTVVRDELDEPVDIIRAKSHDNDDTIIVRWYGVDNAAMTHDTPSNLRHRAATVANFARDNDIEKIVVGVGDSDDDLTELGGGYVSDQKHLPWIGIEDYASDEQVKALTPQGLESFIDECLAERDDELLRSLVDVIDDTRLSELLDEYTSTHDENALLAIKQVARFAIERNADSTDSVRVYSEDGVPLRQRSDVITQVKGGGVRRIAVFPSVDSTREPGARYLETTSVASVAGFPDYTRMRAAFDDPDFITQIDTAKAWAVLYAVIHERDTDTAQQLAVNRSANGNNRDGATLFERIGEARDRYGLDDAEVYKKRRLRRMLAVVTLTALPMGAGIGAGMAFSAESNAAVSQLNTACEQYFHVKDTNFYTDCYPGVGDKATVYNRRAHGLQTDYNKSLNKLDGALLKYQTEVPAYIAQFLVDHAGLNAAAQLSSAFQDKELQKHASLIAKLHGTPPDMYAKDAQNSLIGDVPGSENRIVYTIKPLRGGSSAGYWPTQQFNRVDATSQSTTVFHNGSINFSYTPPENQEGVSNVSYTVPYELNDIEKQNPDYMVETPYIGFKLDGSASSNEAVALPVKQGYTIIGARYVDKADPSRVMPVSINNPNGIAPTAMPFGTGQITSLQNPALQYWIKKTNVTTRPVSQMSAEALDGIHVLSTADKRTVAVAVRGALGLADTASPDEVLAAIRDHHTYAYTPFTRQNVNPVVMSKKNSVQLMTTVGGVLADLKSYNCNLASAEYLLATLDDSSKRALETGFRNDGENNYLTTQGAHAWTIDSAGHVVDPTPQRMAPGVKPRTNIDTTPASKPDKNWTLLDLINERDAELALGALGLLMAWKERRKLAARSGGALVKGLFATKAVQQVVDHHIHTLYASPDAEYTPRPGTKISGYEAARKYVNNIPTGSGPRSLRPLDHFVRSYADRT